ncbi:hypothetical protein JOM56_004284 [Amanita muscaria]
MTLCFVSVPTFLGASLVESKTSDKSLLRHLFPVSRLSIDLAISHSSYQSLLKTSFLYFSRSPLTIHHLHVT